MSFTFIYLLRIIFTVASFAFLSLSYYSLIQVQEDDINDADDAAVIIDITRYFRPIFVTCRNTFRYAASFARYLIISYRPRAI